MTTPEGLTLAWAKATSDYVIFFEEDGRILYANPAFTRAILEGQPAEGQNLLALLDSSSVERARKVIAALANGPQQVELAHSKKDGRPQPVHYSLCRMEGHLGALGRDKTPDLELLGEIVELNIQLENKQAELADANARLEQLAVTDQLTSLYNRHYFFSVVQHLYEEARRYDLPLCCFMMDVDHFKTVNDRFGHGFGDHVLKETAERLRQSSRRSDLLSRYGGEEFVLVAPHTNLETGMMLAGRLRSAVEQEPYVLGNTTAAVTMSLGLSGTEVVRTGPFEELLASADQALYAAKEGGRNRYVVYQPAGGRQAKKASGDR